MLEGEKSGTETKIEKISKFIKETKVQIIGANKNETERLKKN